MVVIHHSSHCWTRSQDSSLLCFDESPPRDARNVTGGSHVVLRYARWISGLSHHSNNLSHLHNLLQKVVIHALLNTRFKGIQIVTYPFKHQTTKSILTKVFPKSLGACSWIDKVNSSFRIYSCSMRGTDIAKVEGQWLNNRPNHSVPATQMTAPKLKLAFLIYFPPPVAWAITVTSLNDITIICSTFSVGKPTAHVQRKWHDLSVHLPPLPLESPITIATPEPHCPFPDPNFMPVTYIYMVYN